MSDKSVASESLIPKSHENSIYTRTYLYLPNKLQHVCSPIVFNFQSKYINIHSGMCCGVRRKAVSVCVYKHWRVFVYASVSV